MRITGMTRLYNTGPPAQIPQQITFIRLDVQLTVD